MAQFSFGTFPATPVWTVPALPVNVGHAIRQSSGVVLPDGRVLHIWYEGKSTNVRSGYLMLGYAPDVFTYLTVNGSVVYDRTLVTNLENTSGSLGQGHLVWGNVSRGPDGALWLLHACFGGDNLGNWSSVVTYGPTMQPPPEPYVTRSMIWRSTDEGDTWQYVTAMPQSVSLVSRNREGDPVRVCLGGIEIVPAGFPNAGRWLCTAASAHNYFGARVWSGAIYASDDNGASWFRVLTGGAGGADGTYISAGSYAFGSDGCIYVRSMGNYGVIGRANGWWRSCDGGTTWAQTQPNYPTPNPPDENTGAGPWLTIDGPNRIAGVAPRPPFRSDINVRIRENDLLTDPVPFWNEAGTLATPDTYTMTFDTGLPGTGGMVLRHLDSTWAGLWHVNQLLGLPLASEPIPNVDNYVDCGGG